MNQERKNITLAIILVLIAGAIWYLETKKPPAAARGGTAIEVPQSASSAGTGASAGAKDRSAELREKALRYPRAKELAGIVGYINTEPFTLSNLVGKKVILVDFWTYSCINCLRTLPYLASWYAKYKDMGFAIVGVHTPEFEFEKRPENVARATRELGVAYPVVLDSNRATWDAYKNRFWPREYLIDIDGYIVHDKIGEGGYDETEALIQQLLAERAEVLGTSMPKGIAVTAKHADDIEAGSPETYFGALRNDLLGNGSRGAAGTQTFAAPRDIAVNTLYLVGHWNIRPEYAVTLPKEESSAAAGEAKILYRYRAKRVYFVAGASGEPIEIEILRDGKPLSISARGNDVIYKNGRSYLRIDGEKLYKAVEDNAFGEHLLEFIIPAAGLQAFTFTFG